MQLRLKIFFLHILDGYDHIVTDSLLKKKTKKMRRILVEFVFYLNQSNLIFMKSWISGWRGRAYRKSTDNHQNNVMGYNGKCISLKSGSFLIKIRLICRRNNRSNYLLLNLSHPTFIIYWMTLTYCHNTARIII